MKTTIRLLTLLFALSLFGCSDNSGPATPPENPDPTPTEPATEVEPPPAAEL